MRKKTEIIIRTDVVPLAMSDNSVTLAGVEIVTEYLPHPAALYSQYMMRGYELIGAISVLVPPALYPRA